MSVCDNTSKLLYQYAGSPNLLRLLLALSQEHCNLSLEMVALQTRLDIDLSEGVQLDGIGEIIGQPRPMNIQIDPDEAFGFDEEGISDPSFPTPTPPDYGWSGIGRADRGGRFVGINGLIVGYMPDLDYRTLLKARIFSNGAKGTVDEIGSFLAYCVGPGTHQVFPGIGYVDIYVARKISSVELDIIEALIPLAAGIRLRNVTQP